MYIPKRSLKLLIRDDDDDDDEEEEVDVDNGIIPDGWKEYPDWMVWDGWLYGTSCSLVPSPSLTWTSVMIFFAVLLVVALISYFFYFRRYGCGKSAWCRFYRKRHPEKYNLAHETNQR